MWYGKLDIPCSAAILANQRHLMMALYGRKMFWERRGTIKNKFNFRWKYIVWNIWYINATGCLNTVLEIHTAEPLIPDSSPFEVEIAIRKLKRYKLPGSDQITAELIKAGGETLRFEIHNIINSTWNNEELSAQWKESIVVPVHKKDDNTDCSNYCGMSLLSPSYKIVSSIILKVKSISRWNYWGWSVWVST
jgi:hypothetical protein